MLNIGRNLLKQVGQNIKSACVNEQQIRTTYVFKRRTPPPLKKKGHGPPVLKGRHFVYELLECRHHEKGEDLKLILNQFVEGVGHKGDVVTVKRHAGYYKLLLPGLAEYFTEEARERLQTGREDGGVREHSSPFAVQTVKTLAHLMVDVTMNLEEPWTIEPWHIRMSLRKAGIHVASDSQIEMPPGEIKGPDMELENKEFLVTITINNLEKAPVRCRIHHWSTQPTERLPYVSNPWLKPTEAIFPEQAEALAAMPPPGTKRLKI